MSGILQCFADRPEEKVRKWAPAVFLTPRSFAHIEFEWRLMQDEQNEAHSPLELTIAPLSMHVYCLFGQSLCVSLKDVRFCLETQNVSSLPWAPETLCGVCVSIDDSSPHLGVSPLPPSLYLCIPSLPGGGRKEGERVRSEGPWSVTWSVPPSSSRGSNTILRNQTLDPDSATQFPDHDQVFPHS